MEISFFDEEKARYFYNKDDHGWYDYTPLISYFGHIILRVDDTDYQGDSRVLYEEGERYGYLNFGWGSCSGCDSLQACDTASEV